MKMHQQPKYENRRVAERYQDLKEERVKVVCPNLYCGTAQTVNLIQLHGDYYQCRKCGCEWDNLTFTIGKEGRDVRR